MKSKGVSLMMATALILIIFFLSMVSLAMVTASANVTRSVYQTHLTLNRAMDGPYEASPDMLADAPVWSGPLTQDDPFFTDDLVYGMFGNLRVEVEMRDNDDLDDDLEVDLDKRFILTSRGYIVDETGAGSEVSVSRLDVLVKYLGTDDGYAQETGSAKSQSYFYQEVSGF